MPSNKPYQLAYFVSHPIQYQAPLLKLLSTQEDIELTVFFLCDISTKKFKDYGFGNDVEWDVPLLDGYKHSFLESTFSDGDFGLNNPKVNLKSVKQAVLSQQWDAIWIHGYANLALLYIVYLSSKYRIPLMLRGESNLVSTSMGTLKTLFMKSLLKRCSALLSIGSDNREFYQYYGVAKEKIFHVPYAVDNDSFQKKITDITPSNKTIILFASKFIARKHPVLLIQAYAQLDKKLRDNSELWFIGDGEQRATMEQEIARLELNNSVKLLGFKNQTELPNYFAQCNVFVLPSEKEPFGLVVNEVMNQGKAIITTTQVGAAKDLVIDGKNGWVIEAGSLTALKTALNDALQNTERLNQMGQSSLEQISTWSFKEDIDGIRAALNSLDVSRA